jgi:hypothetical protein
VPDSIRQGVDLDLAPKIEPGARGMTVRATFCAVDPGASCDCSAACSLRGSPMASTLALEPLGGRSGFIQVSASADCSYLLTGTLAATEPGFERMSEALKRRIRGGTCE